MNIVSRETRPAAHQFMIEVPVLIRPCEQGDLRRLEWSGVFAQDRDVLRQAYFRQRCGTAIMLLAVAADALAAHLWIDFTHVASGRVTLWALRVVPSLRNYGIGAELLRVAEQHAVQRGGRHLDLTVDRRNLDALRFYERHGFSIVRASDVNGRSPEDGGSTECWLLTKAIAAEPT